MPTFDVYVDGVHTVTIEEDSREDALEKVAEWNGLSVVEKDPPLKVNPEERLPPFSFRQLDEEESDSFETWAREHATPDELEKWRLVHPVVYDTWIEMGLLEESDGK